MSRQLQAALGVILTNPVAFFLLWDFPGYEGFVASTVILLVGLFFYMWSERTPSGGSGRPRSTSALEITP
jgi:hypothetical protein